MAIGQGRRQRLKAIATTLVAILAMALATSACQSAAPPAGGLGQETKKGLPTVVVAAVKRCANRPALPFTRRRVSSKRHGECFVLRAIQNALADCGLNGLSPRNDSCGTLGGVAAFGIGAQLGLLRGIEVVNLAVRAKDCADGKGFCDAMQTVQTLVDCGLKAAAPAACDQVIAEAEAQWPQQHCAGQGSRTCDQVVAEAEAQWQAKDGDND